MWHYFSINLFEGDLDFFDLTPIGALGPKFLKKIRWFFGRNDGTKETF